MDNNNNNNNDEGNNGGEGGFDSNGGVDYNILPPLPDIKSPTLVQLMRGPTNFCNWVIPGRLLAGENLAFQEDGVLKKLVKTVGLRCYVNLCEDEEVSIEKRSRVHAIIDSHPSPCPSSSIHFPILDGDCPTNRDE
eukprot:TRINITY_DN134_c0_g1_i5.p1 TRINITY_DN134_c0_g1~~TRINITY_DN134_c0_g1_i5.p1  ORF type:complete len:136 (-),score=33.63 TRINITY_DN134_c0_g1_i5:48-455(-)